MPSSPKAIPSSNSPSSASDCASHARATTAGNSGYPTCRRLRSLSSDRAMRRKTSTARRWSPREKRAAPSWNSAAMRSDESPSASPRVCAAAARSAASVDEPASRAPHGPGPGLAEADQRLLPHLARAIVPGQRRVVPLGIGGVEILEGLRHQDVQPLSPRMHELVVHDLANPLVGEVELLAEAVQH